MKKIGKNSLVILGYLASTLLLVGSAKAQNNFVQIQTQQKMFLRIDVINANVFRIRVSDQNAFVPALTERYGIVQFTSANENVLKTEKGNEIELKTKNCTLFVNSKNGAVSIKKDGKKIVDLTSVLAHEESNSAFCEKMEGTYSALFPAKDNQQIIGAQKLADSIKSNTLRKKFRSFARFKIDTNERFYGGGSASREGIQHRNKILRMWAEYKKSEAPIPFIYSSGNWGVFNNTCSKNYFDIDKSLKNELLIYNESQDIDLSIITGTNYSDLLAEYTTITGKPYLMPKWAYGLAFGSNTLENQFNVLENAWHFRNEKIPCDIYWLEPQWMAKNYDFSTNKNWDENKFQVAYWWLQDPTIPHARNLFVNRMKDMGFKMALWLCVDNDLTIEEEDAIAKVQNKPESGKEHWFPHLNKFIAQGIAGFKIDPAHTINEFPGRIYHNGFSDAEMHNLNQVLVLKQMKNTFEKATGLRSFHHYCGGYAGSQHWGAATIGDNGGGPKTLLDVINLGISGNPSLSVDVLEDVVNKKEGIHYAFFLPWVQINSWAWLLHPWLFNEDDKETFKFYAQLRYSLIPYIYSNAIRASLTGTPIVKPMSFVYTNKPEYDELNNQFLFGDNFLVSAFTSSVVLPDGEWIDYWTDSVYTGNRKLEMQIPARRGGALFVKNGSIIPVQKNVQFISTEPQDTLLVNVYPNHHSSFVLYEDDGKSYAYKEGKIQSTLFECNDEKDIVRLSVESKDVLGIKKRNYCFEIKTDQKPKSVIVNAKKIDGWKFTTNHRLSFDVTLVNNQKIEILINK